ncbi:hypothetical protein BX600DRAFT_460271 [Xylariales sp. PMI_506]|nr:hypothetical protein BX600DRAFT_460271 [Xylariales sp. PMI_506]
MAGPAATAPPSIKRTILQSIPIPALPGWESRLVLVEYPPGVTAPVHTHPVAATGYVLQGKVVSQWEDGELEQYEAGDSFIDHGTRTHLRSENVSDTMSLKLLFSYVIQLGQSTVDY